MDRTYTYHADPLTEDVNTKATLIAEVFEFAGLPVFPNDIKVYYKPR